MVNKYLLSSTIFAYFIRIRSPIRKCIKCAASHGVGIYAFAICAQRKQGRRCFRPHPRASSSICSSMVTPTRLVVTLRTYLYFFYSSQEKRWCNHTRQFSTITATIVNTHAEYVIGNMRSAFAARGKCGVATISTQFPKQHRLAKTCF